MGVFIGNHSKLGPTVEDVEGPAGQPGPRVVLVQKRDKGDRGLKGDTGAQGLREMRVKR